VSVIVLPPYPRRRPVLDAEPFRVVILDEDYWQAPRAVAAWTARQVFADDSELPFAAAVTIVDEDAWLGSLPQQRALSLAAITDDEVLPQALVVTIVDEDGYFVTQQPGWAVSRAVLLGDEELVPQPAPFGLDDEYWSSPAQLLVRFAPQIIWDDEVWTDQPPVPIPPAVVVAPVAVSSGTARRLFGPIDWSRIDELKAKAKKKSKKAVRLVEEIAAREVSLAVGLEQLQEELKEARIVHAKVYRELLELEIARKRYEEDSDDEEVILLLMH
jgi:hypothetical protein